MQFKSDEILDIIYNNKEILNEINTANNINEKFNQVDKIKYKKE
jgi:hypothetical protein